MAKTREDVVLVFGCDSCGQTVLSQHVGVNKIDCFDIGMFLGEPWMSTRGGHNNLDNQRN